MWNRFITGSSPCPMDGGTEELHRPICVGRSVARLAIPVCAVYRTGHSARLHLGRRDEGPAAGSLAAGVGAPAQAFDSGDTSYFARARGENSWVYRRGRDGTRSRQSLTTIQTPTTTGRPSQAEIGQGARARGRGNLVGPRAQSDTREQLAEDEEPWPAGIPLDSKDHPIELSRPSALAPRTVPVTTPSARARSKSTARRRSCLEECSAATSCDPRSPTI